MDVSLARDLDSRFHGNDRGTNGNDRGTNWNDRGTNGNDRGEMDTNFVKLQ